MRAPRAQRGFTLIEMMVVVAIIGLLSLLFISLSARTYGANADTVSDELVSQIGFAKQRAVETRRYHCVELRNVVASPPYQTIIVYQANTIGMASPATVCPTITNWQRVQSLNIPVGSSIWDVETTIYAGSGSFTPTQNPALDATITFKPDGTSTTGITAFVTDSTGARKDRIIVYNTTGDVYARKYW